jgi:uncharacterized membrane protein HdeD (DUF308 family)
MAVVGGGPAVPQQLLQRVLDHWWLVVLRGALAVIFGVLAIMWPVHTLAALIILFGAYSLVDGVFAFFSALRFGVHSERWWPLIFEAVIGIAAGVLVLGWPSLAALSFAIVFAAWALVTGVFEIIAALRLHRLDGRFWWLILAAVLSLAVGVYFVVWPGAGLIAFVWVIGIYALLFGIAMLIMGFRMNAARRSAA